MKIHQPGNIGSFISKFCALFPAAIALVLYGEHFFVKLLSLLLFSLAIYTFFFTKYERYLDTDNKCTIKRFRWLFIKTEEIEPISQFESLTISACRRESQWHSFGSTMAFNVVLVRKYAASKTYAGFGALENFLLKSMITDIGEASSFALAVGEAVGLPVAADKDLVECLTYDPLKPEDLSI